jgi:hypothetical protein
VSTRSADRGLLRLERGPRGMRPQAMTQEENAARTRPLPGTSAGQIIARWRRWQLQLSPIDQLSMGVAGLLCVASVPLSIQSSWSVRVAIVLLAIPLGVMTLVRLVRRRDVAAMFVAAFLLVVMLSALLSQAPRFALLGSI